MSFYCDAAFGLPFGTEFEIIKDNLVPISATDKTEGDHSLIQTECSEDNRKIFDDGSAQKLSHEDIHVMKRKGLSGQVIKITYLLN